MGDPKAAPFANNWAYLKWELRWLDRLLLTAVSRQRREDKALKPVIQTEQDRVTSPWWQGIVTLPATHPREEGPPPVKAPSGSYSQQLEARIQASQQAGISLALPQVRATYSLTTFEKNLVLLALAPEINRRYGRLYDYLQSEAGMMEDLPTVDLCLRLLCRSEQSWQSGRSRLVAADSVAEQGLVEWVGDEGTLLSQQVRLTDPLVNYLLAEDPPLQVPLLMEPWARAGQATAALAPAAAEAGDNGAETELERGVSSAATVSEGSGPEIGEATPGSDGATAPTLVAAPHIPSGDWQTLVVPRPLQTALKALGRQGRQRHQWATVPGLVVLFVGCPGTGKTLAATAIAADMEQSLAILDLATIPPDDDDTLLESSLADGRPLLVQGGDRWLGRRATAEPAWVHQWWHQRQHTSGLTLVTVPHLHAIQPHWRQRFDTILHFPRPDKRARRRLWEQAWPPEVTMGKDIDWGAIATQWPFTGGEIHRIAQTAWCDLHSRDRTTLTLAVLKAAIALHHP